MMDRTVLLLKKKRLIKVQKRKEEENGKMHPWTVLSAKEIHETKQRETNKKEKRRMMRRASMF